MRFRRAYALMLGAFVALGASARAQELKVLQLVGAGEVDWGGEHVRVDAIPSWVRAHDGKPCADRIYVRADLAPSYGEVLALMNSLRDAGCSKVAIVGEAKAR